MIVVDVVGTIIDIAYVVQFELAGEQLRPLDRA
jgi:hypothetical protein